MIRVYQGDQENHLETFAEGMIADQWRDMTDEELESCMAAFAAALPAVLPGDHGAHPPVQRPARVPDPSRHRVPAGGACAANFAATCVANVAAHTFPFVSSGTGDLNKRVNASLE